MARALADSGTGIGVVTIGRNEGERLHRCLLSVRESAAAVVYVDSGSADGSVELARRLGVEVVALDAGVPFTAARARNAGYRRLRSISPSVRHVQFVDGDCEIAAGWMETAAQWLDQHPRIAVVCGRRRERFPERSVYNLLCDIEWDTPLGEVRSCGGDAMIRAAAFEAVGGFREDLIAGEEPELCVRMRAAGWTIWRIAHEMTLHDAAMTRIGQWWRRAMRAGYAAAQAVAIHGSAPERHGVAQTRSIWFWAFALPSAAGLLAATGGGMALGLLALYPAQVARIALRGSRSARENWWYAFFLVLGKFPELFGQIRFLWVQCTGAAARLIEYK